MGHPVYHRAGRTLKRTLLHELRDFTKLIITVTIPARRYTSVEKIESI